jgi:hypothetical protein
MATILSPVPKLQFFTAAGVPLVGGKLFSYAAGTSSPLATYADSTGVTANTNPVILDSRGEANVWLASNSYKFKLTDSNNVEIWTVDNISTAQALVDTVQANLTAYAASLAAPTGSSLVGFLQAGTGATARTVQAKNRDIVNVKDFGAVGNGVADDTAAIQAAINQVASLGGGEVVFNMGKYLITSGLTARVGVLLNGLVRTDVSSNTNGSGTTAAKPIMIWGGAADGTMYRIYPAIAGDCVWGGGATNLEWDGGTLAAAGVWLDNTKYATFNGKVRNVRYAGVIVDSTSGSPTNFSMKNQIESLEFIWGVAPACQPAIGLLLSGNGATGTVPSTQQYIGDLSGLVYNGALAQVAATDNAQFQSIHGVVQTGGTGCSLKLLNTGFQAANHTFVAYCVGPIQQDNGVIGTDLLDYNSEGGGIYQLAGSSTWDGDLIDYATGDRWLSHKWALRDKISVKNSDFVPDTAMTTVQFALQWNGYAYSATTDQTASCVIPSPYWLNNGTIEGVELIVGTNGTSAGNYVIKADMSVGTTAGIAVTPQRTQTQTLAAGAQYTPTTYTFNFAGVPQYFAKYNHIFFKFTRLGTNASDTNTDPMVLLGARVMYVGTGPETGGSGTYYIPAWN